MARPREIKNPVMVGAQIPKETEKALQLIAARETAGNLSDLIRKALAEYARTHAAGNSTYPLDSFADPSFFALPSIGKLLTPEYLDQLADVDLADLGRAAAGRHQEITAAARRRRWTSFDHRWIP
jgi:hypothetical protein